MKSASSYYRKLCTGIFKASNADFPELNLNDAAEDFQASRNH